MSNESFLERALRNSSKAMHNIGKYIERGVLEMKEQDKPKQSFLIARPKELTSFSLQDLQEIAMFPETVKLS